MYHLVTTPTPRYKAQDRRRKRHTKIRRSETFPRVVEVIYFLQLQRTGWGAAPRERRTNYFPAGGSDMLSSIHRLHTVAAVTCRKLIIVCGPDITNDATRQMKMAAIQQRQ